MNEEPKKTKSVAHTIGSIVLTTVGLVLSCLFVQNALPLIPGVTLNPGFQAALFFLGWQYGLALVAVLVILVPVLVWVGPPKVMAWLKNVGPYERTFIVLPFYLIVQLIIVYLLNWISPGGFQAATWPALLSTTLAMAVWGWLVTKVEKYGNELLSSFTA